MSLEPSPVGLVVQAHALDFVGREIAARQAELADLLAREEGKPLAEAHGAVLRASHSFRFFAGEALRTAGELLPSTRAGLSVEITREPVGVVSTITPWNFPIAIPAWKIAPALAYGNAVVFKPAELVPGCAWALAEILSRAGLPEGSFNLVMGRGRDLGDQLFGHPRVAASAVARPGAMARVQLKMGGKNPLVVLGDARQASTTVGPVVDASQLQQDLNYIEAARSEGTELAFGGQHLPEVNGLRPVGRCVHHLIEAGRSLQASAAGRHGDGQRAHCRGWTRMCPLAAARPRATDHASRGAMRPSSTRW